MFTGFVGRLKTDKGLIVRLVVGSILLLTTVGLGFGLLIRTWVYQHHHTKFALEAIGWSDPNFTETFPQFTICPGYFNNTHTHHIEQGKIVGVQCNFHDVTAVTHDPESTQKKDVVTPITSIKQNTHTIDFRKYESCYDINIDESKSPKIQWHDSHSYIGCRVEVNTYIHIQPYGFGRHRPSHVMAHYNTVKNGEATLLSVRAEEVSGFPHTFYEIDREDEELRFHTGGRPDHLYFTMTFSRFTKRRYQAFHSAHQQTDVMIGVIGGFGLLFFMLYKLVSVITGLFTGSSRVGYETQQ